jgi:hypothetical protein
MAGRWGAGTVVTDASQPGEEAPVAAMVDPVALVRALAGADIDVDVLATDPWSARMLLVDRYRGQRVFLWATPRT